LLGIGSEIGTNNLLTPPLPDGLPEHVKDLIKNGRPKGQRSEEIMIVLRALCAVGMADGDIIAVVLAYPIGEKAREHQTAAGQWLAGQIVRARAHLANDGRDDAVLARIERVVKVASTNFGQGLRVTFDLLIGEGQRSGQIIRDGVSTNGGRGRLDAFFAATGVSWWTDARPLVSRIFRVTIRDTSAIGRPRVARFFPVEA
jgi:hypothetical protein